MRTKAIFYSPTLEGKSMRVNAKYIMFIRNMNSFIFPPIRNEVPARSCSIKTRIRRECKASRAF